MYWDPKEQSRKLQGAEAANEGGNYGPGSWMYWQKQRQLLGEEPSADGAATGRKLMSADAANEGGNYGPGSWMYWQKQRQLLAAQAANEGGNYGRLQAFAFAKRHSSKHGAAWQSMQ
jgi:hypothetical protein